MKMVQCLIIEYENECLTYSYIGPYLIITLLNILSELYRYYTVCSVGPRLPFRLQKLMRVNLSFVLLQLSEAI